ncbi:hypothetical protein M758_8G031500 [Ceratodon purpureus]|nr:hypothetical protein M758_8G031500 [Ceratodon purpureus]
MLINGKDDGGFSHGEGKSAEQVRFFSTEKNADFHQRSVPVVEFGSRHLKRARFLSDSDDPVREALVDRRGLARGDLLEESNGDLGGISESSSGVTNGFRSRSAGMKVAGPIHASDYLQNGVKNKTASEQKSRTHEDEKRGFFKHGNINGDAGCMTHPMEEDADDTTSTSGDEGLFVIQVRSPTSKQLLHSRKHSNDQEELQSCNGQARSKTAELHDSPHSDNDERSDRLVKIQAPSMRSKDVNGLNDDRESDRSRRHRSDAHYMEHADANEYHNNGSIDGSNQLLSGVSRNFIKRDEATDIEGLVIEQVGHSAPQVHEFIPSDMENSAKVIQEASAVGVSDAGREEEAEIRNVYVRKRKQSTPADKATVPSQDHGSSQSEDLVGERVVKHYVRRPHRQTDSHSPADRNKKPSEHAMTSSSNLGGKEPVDSLQVEHHTDTSVTVEAEGNLNVFQRRSKMNHLSQAEHHVGDVSTPIADSAGVESEENLNVFRRRSKMNNVLETEHHTEISARSETEGNLHVFQRRSKIHHTPQAENDADVSMPKADVARVESEGKLNVFHRRSIKNQLPEAEHHTDTSASIEKEVNLNVFQRRSKMNHLSQPGHHVDVSPPKADVARVESEGNLNVFRRRSKTNKLPELEPEVDADVSDRVETEGNLNVFQRRSKINPSPKEPSRNEVVGVQKGVNEKHIPAGYVRADHQPNWLPEGWTLEIREGNTTAKPRDKYYHHNTSGRIFRSKNEVLQFLVDGGVGGSQVVSGGSGMKVQSQNERRPPVPIADAGAPGLNGGAADSSPLLSSGNGIQLANGSPVSTVKSASDQEDKENRGKLIFRLKRKQPDSEGGKGRSKRPMYEVVHGEKASSSMSTPTNQEKLTTGERTGQDVPSTPGSVQMPLQRISSMTESLSPNVVSGSMPVKAQVEKHIPLEKPSFTSPRSLVQVTSSRGVPDSKSLEHSTMSNWGIKYNPLQHPSQHLELLQQEPYTALGIPATARYSGLQQMASYSANHTHVFLDPVDNTLPLSWQYPFTSQASTSVTASLPTLGPFPSTSTPSAPKTFSSTVPTPLFENGPGVPSLNLNATATMFPCSESGVDSRTKDSASNAKLADGGPQVHKALKAPKPLTKSDHTKLFLDLGRRLCLAGIEHKSRVPESIGTLKPPLDPQIPVTNLEGKEQPLRTDPGCSGVGR